MISKILLQSKLEPPRFDEFIGDFMKYFTLSHLGRPKRLLLICLFIFAALSCPACRFCHNKKSWEPPVPASAAHRPCELTDIAKTFSPDAYSPIDKEPSVPLLESVEAAYTFACASRSPQQAVDAYYEALVRSWIFFSQYHSYIQLDNENHRAWDIYHSSLARIISAGPSLGATKFTKRSFGATPPAAWNGCLFSLMNLLGRTIVLTSLFQLVAITTKIYCTNIGDAV